MLDKPANGANEIFLVDPRDESKRLKNAMDNQRKFATVCQKFMKNNQLTGVFLGLFFLSTLATAVLIVKYNSSLRQLQRVQAGVMTINALQSLFNEANEYSKTHPDMKAVLQPFTAAPRTGAPTTSRPSR